MKIPRRERERLRRRKDILATALRLFSEKGYHSVTMQEIAGESEFAIGTIYKFFKNKKDLYKALILEQTNRFHDELSLAIQSSDREIEQLRGFVAGKGEFVRANVAMIRLYMAETRGTSYHFMAGLDEELRRRHQRFLETLAAVFERGIEGKRFQRIADPYHLAVALDSLTTAFLFLWLEAPERQPYPEDPDTILNILFKGLTAS